MRTAGSQPCFEKVINESRCDLVNVSTEGTVSDRTREILCEKKRAKLVKIMYNFNKHTSLL